MTQTESKGLTVPAWADAVAIANGLTVVRGRRHRVYRLCSGHPDPDRRWAHWAVCEAGA